MAVVFVAWKLFTHFPQNSYWVLLANLQSLEVVFIVKATVSGNREEKYLRKSQV